MARYPLTKDLVNVPFCTRGSRAAATTSVFSRNTEQDGIRRGCRPCARGSRSGLGAAPRAARADPESLTCDDSLYTALLSSERPRPRAGQAGSRARSTQHACRINDTANGSIYYSW